MDDKIVFGIITAFVMIFAVVATSIVVKKDLGLTWRQFFSNDWTPRNRKDD